jgi:ribosomal protein S18 acetylase RimI-like enzyme
VAHRNRGLARAVVSLATARGRDQAELVFLCADAHDWPQHLYRRLGYEPIGLLHRFCPTLPGQPTATP